MALLAALPYNFMWFLNCMSPSSKASFDAKQHCLLEPEGGQHRDPQLGDWVECVRYHNTKKRGSLEV